MVLASRILGFFLMNFDQPIPLKVSLVRCLQSRGDFFLWCHFLRDSSGGGCTHHPSFVSARDFIRAWQHLKGPSLLWQRPEQGWGSCPGVSLWAVNAAPPRAMPTTSLILLPSDPFHARKWWNCAVVSLKSGAEPGTMDCS